jgi:hypothetical protein
MASPHDERWNAHLENYRAFVLARGRHPRRPAVDDLEARLSEWAHEQRRLFRGQRARPLRSDRQAELESIAGWQWNPRRGPIPRPDRWESQRQAVERHFIEFGRYPRLNSEDPRERRLAGWVKNQVERLPSRDDDLGRSRYDAVLATPGWPIPRQQTWLGMVQLLEAFVVEFGRLPKRTPARTADVPEREQHERMLSMWCANQRRFERAATIDRPYPEERRARLDRVSGWSWAKPHAHGRRRAKPSFTAPGDTRQHEFVSDEFDSELAAIEHASYVS